MPAPFLPSPGCLWAAGEVSFPRNPGAGGGAGVAGDASVSGGSGGTGATGGGNTGGVGAAPTGGAGGVTTGGSGGVAATGGANAGTAGADAGGGSDGGGTDASDDGGGTDAGDDAGVVTKCPSSPPPLASACDKGLVCTYGAHPNADCRASYTCGDSGWTTKTPTCPPVVPCKNLSVIPVIGKSCTGIDAGVPSGTVRSQPDPKNLCHCTCSACSPGQEQWECAGPVFGCPDVIPNRGRPCTKPNGSNSCPYYGCAFGWATEATRSAYCTAINAGIAAVSPRAVVNSAPAMEGAMTPIAELLT